VELTVQSVLVDPELSTQETVELVPLMKLTTARWVNADPLDSIVA
jgi:hypothetical protein